MEKVPMGNRAAQIQKALFAAKTVKFRFDGQGRLPLNEPLLRHAGLAGQKDELVLVRMGNQLNLYSKPRWEELNQVEEDLGGFLGLLDTIESP